MRTRPRTRNGCPRIWTGTFFLAGLLTALGWSSSAFAVDRYAWPGGGGVPPCTDAANPCPFIADALNAAVAGDEIILGTGTFLEHGLTIPIGLTIAGAGQGLSIINAQGNGRHFEIAAPGDLVILKDMTLTHGDAGGGQGGALLVNSGRLEVVGTEISRNRGFSGGAISCYLLCEGLTVQDSTLADNTATLWGGAIYAQAGTIVQSTTISGNTAIEGGAIWKQGGPLTVRDSEITDNTATGSGGGGIWSLGDSIKIERSALIGNAAPVGTGGGVYASGGVVDEVLMMNTTVSANTADVGGGLSLGAMVVGFVGNTTMVDNSDNSGASDLSVGATFTLSNTILTHPNLGAGNQCAVPAGASMGGENNLIDTLVGCPGTAANFRLGAITLLGNNPRLHNGPTRSYSLLPGSNAIDGTGGDCRHPRTGAVVGIDQRSYPRPPGLCDIGSFERQ